MSHIYKNHVIYIRVYGGEYTFIYILEPSQFQEIQTYHTGALEVKFACIKIRAHFILNGIITSWGSRLWADCDFVTWNDETATTRIETNACHDTQFVYILMTILHRKLIALQTASNSPVCDDEEEEFESQPCSAFE